VYHPVSLVHRRRAAVVACPTGCDRNRRQANVSVLPDTNQATAELTACLRRLAPLHARLCPRQVLGARIGLHAGELLGCDLPRLDKRLIAVVETDGCAVDGVAAATGCSVGRRTMRIVDFGKVAATFADTATGRAVRIAPRRDARARTAAFSSTDPWEAMLLGYQRLPTTAILEATPVELTTSLAALISRPGLHRPCDRCGEEIMNEREVNLGGAVLCRSCAGERYYTPVRRPE
jgi:formylmethanofuran dehydrogenase subunit E